MRKLAILFTMIFVFMMGFTTGNAEAGVWLAESWLTKGTGWAEKGILRTEADNSGSVLLGISTGADGRLYVVSVDIKAELNLSKLNIGTWDFAETTTFNNPIPIPDGEPGVSNPFEIEGIPFETDEVRMSSYKISIYSSTQGRAQAQGEIKEHGIEFDLENVIWQQGTPEPADPENESGCNSFFGLPALLLAAFFALKKLVK